MRSPSASAPPLVVSMFVVLLLLPQEASLFIGDLRLTPARAFLLLIFPLACARFWRKLSADMRAVCWSDLFVIPIPVWFVTADAFTDGPLRALVGAGVLGFDFVGAYIIIRGLLTNASQVVSVTRMVSVLIAAIGLLGLLDTLSGSYITHDTIARLTGFPEGPQQEPRYGLIRADGTFEHPILLGANCAAAIVLAISLRGLSRWFTLLGASVGLVASISSGPISGALLGLLCVAYRRITIDFAARWRALKISVFVLLSPIFVLQSSPFSFLFAHLTLDPSTAFYRLLIWQFGGALVMASPLVGIGMTQDWARLSWMGSSIDTVWLHVAMEFGIPAVVLLAGTVIGSCSKSVDTRPTALSPAERNLGAALGVVIFQYVFNGFSVDYWGITWMMLGVMAGLRAQLGAAAYSGSHETAASDASAAARLAAAARQEEASREVSPTG